MHILLGDIVIYAVEANLRVISRSLHRCFEGKFKAFSSWSLKFSHTMIPIV